MKPMKFKDQEFEEWWNSLALVDDRRYLPDGDYDGNPIRKWDAYFIWKAAKTSIEKDKQPG